MRSARPDAAARLRWPVVVECYDPRRIPSSVRQCSCSPAPWSQSTPRWRLCERLQRGHRAQRTPHRQFAPSGQLL